MYGGGRVSREDLQVLWRAWGLQAAGGRDGQTGRTGGQMDESQTKAGSEPLLPGPARSVILHREVVLGGLLDALELAGLPLPDPLHLSRELLQVPVPPPGSV